MLWSIFGAWWEDNLYLNLLILKEGISDLKRSVVFCGHLDQQPSLVDFISRFLSELLRQRSGLVILIQYHISYPSVHCSGFRGDFVNSPNSLGTYAIPSNRMKMNYDVPLDFPVNEVIASITNWCRSYGQTDNTTLCLLKTKEFLRFTNSSPSEG